jgi:GNAT superfamily N-acetyltransferase
MTADEGDEDGNADANRTEAEADVDADATDGATPLRLRLRSARPADYEAVAAFTRDTWADREGADYIPRVYHDWIAGDGDDQRTLLFDASDEVDAGEAAAPGGDGADEVAAIAQVVLLSEWEAWLQGMRVNPDYRRRGLATRLTRACFDWARDRGATVARNWIHSWNVPSLGLSRTAGFEPGIETRWAKPTPDPEATAAVDAAGREVGTTGRHGPARAVEGPSAGAAWGFWTRSRTRTALNGLAMDDEETWAVSQLTRDRLAAAAADDRLLVVAGPDGTRGFTCRNRAYTYEPDGEAPTTYAEYAVGAWAPGDVAAASALFAAVGRDAATVDADETRVLCPERVTWVSDAAAAGVALAEEPTFNLEADLGSERTRGSDAPVDSIASVDEGES